MIMKNMKGFTLAELVIALVAVIMITCVAIILIHFATKFW